MVDIPLTDEIKALGVSKVEITKEYLYLYNGQSFAQSRYYKNQLEKTLLELQEKMIFSGHFGDQKTVEKIILLFSDLYVEAQKQVASKNDKKESYSQVYKSKSIIAEAIIVGETPKWLVSKAAGNIAIQDTIDINDDSILVPFEKSAYVNKPYIFNTLETLEKAVTQAREETLDTLYRKVTRIWYKYIAEDDYHISICAADCIFTYFQDKMGLTHYLFFVGDNDSGKSNNLHIIHFLAYRNMLSSDMTPANIYSFLGTEYEGIGTICEDEADDIDEDREKMKIYKNGYTAGIKVFRLDIPQTGGRKQDAYNTFCFKAFAGEKRPNSKKAKGFNQRLVELVCTYGIPKYDISEIINPAGDDEDLEQLEELNGIRNSLLIYRLLHYHDRIPNIKLNLQNREKQLFKPLLRVFQNTETFNVLRPVISQFVNERRQAKANTLTAFLCPIVFDLVDKYGPTLESSSIWNSFKEALPDGELISKYTYKTEEFNEVSHKDITEILETQFYAKRPGHKGNKRKLIFDVKRLERMKEKYNLDLDIKVTNGADGADGAHYGLDRHIFDNNSNIENANNNKENVNNIGIARETGSYVESDQSQGSHLTENNVPQAPHMPQFDTYTNTSTKTNPDPTTTEEGGS